MKKSRSHFILAALGLFLMLLAFLFERASVSRLPQIAGSASRALSEKATLCRQGLDSLLNTEPTTHWQELRNYYEEEEIGLYLWKKDSLLFWNNSQLPLKYDSAAFRAEQGLAKLAHGYYLYFKTKSGEKTALAMCLVKPEYELQNNYLKNDFRAWTHIPAGVRLDTTFTPENEVLLDGKAMFSVKGSEVLYYSAFADNAAFVIFLAGLLVLFVTALRYCSERPSASKFYGFLVLAVLLRCSMIRFHWPAFFYRTEVYNLRLFGNAQSFLNGYLGDILFNAFTWLFIAALFHFYLARSEKRMSRLFYAILLFASVFMVFSQFNQTAFSLINNSTLSFDFLGIFTIKIPVFIGLGALGIYSLALFLLISRSFLLFDLKRTNSMLECLIVYVCLCLIHWAAVPHKGFVENYWLLIYAFALLFLQRLYEYKVALALGVQIILISVVTSTLFNRYIDRNQRQDLNILSVRLGEKQDPILESEFAGIPPSMAADEPLNTLLTFLADIPTAEKEAVLLLKQKYFGGYFDRYNLQFSLFDKNCTPLLEVKDPRLLNEGFFEDQLEYYSDSTATPGLFFVRNNRNVQYIGRIKLKEKNLFVLMEPKQFEELGSFPDLLLDQSQQKPEKLKAFSHAVYRSQQINSRFGDFNYPFSFQDSLTLASSEPGFIHQYYQPDENTDVIISQKAKRWNYFFTFNSYLLLFFSLLTYLCYLCYSLVFTTHFTSPTLTRRIQTIIIVLLLLAMSAVGITSGTLVKRQFRKDNKDQLEEKTQIIINELTSQFDAEQLFDPSQKELVNLKLKEYSRLFNTPISIFYKNGGLFNTSEPKLYDLGLAASFVNPKAYWMLKGSHSSSESVTDKAGTLEYLSLYTPLFDKKQKLMGFINLPYFARQSDLVNELSGIISALINVYVILFVVSILAGLILSSFITQPLRLIKQQLSNVSLGRQNEKITWQSDDEIGRLVSEYNQMLVKLEDSANLLAQSERESAWREMARQVAHEIKNPLTPMKLNLQYLQHLMKNNPSDFREKFERASAGIIEQIDSLANIANAFSSFARLPGTQLETINLAEIINAAVLLFESQKTVPIRNSISEQTIWVKGDRDQCLRVFNNVLKNALQAVEEVAAPEIDIRCEETETSVIVSIQDNGCGIADELKSRIFTPNFTTKTTGSGLGLAMVKNILLGFEGKISFTSEKNAGTTFYLEFKKAEEKPA